MGVIEWLDYQEGPLLLLTLYCIDFFLVALMIREVLMRDPKPKNRALALLTQVIMEQAPFIIFMSLVAVITEMCIIISPNEFRMNFR